jgi:hypothetical protein
VALIPFAAATPCAIHRIEVRVARPMPTRLALEYELLGELAGVRIGDGGPTLAANPLPTEGLWRHTCMEVFVAHDPPGHYLEFNLAPSGQWAAYRFSGYRAGMAPLAAPRAPRIEVRTQSERLLLSAVVDLPLDLSGKLRLGISAVVEDTQGTLSYWALRHAGERPDFHHPDSFGFEL